MIYEDIFSVPIIQNAYKSFSVGKVEMQSPVRALRSLGVG